MNKNHYQLLKYCLDNKCISFWNKIYQSVYPEIKADLTGASLRGADLTGADLIGASLSEADLTGASLSEADLTGAYLSKADLRGAYLSKADLRGADLSEADLTGASLTGASLIGASLSKADLRGANLRGADLIKADLRGANLRGADLYKTEIDAKFEYIDSYQTIYTKNQIQIACEIHSIEHWEGFTNRDIHEMDEETGLDWWKEHRERVIRNAKEFTKRLEAI